MKSSITNSLLLSILFFYSLSLLSCKKDVLKNDEGRVLTFTPKEIAPGLSVGEVYNSNNFAAFTDIAYYNNSWFITFRLGTHHVGGLDGQIEILRSTDGIKWKVENIITNDSLDLRDSKFVIDSSTNTLYLNYSGLVANSNISKFYGFICTYNVATRDWNTPQIIATDNNNDFFFWRFTYSNQKLYSASYHIPILGGYTMDNICLFNNQLNMDRYASLGRLTLGKSPSEATIRVDSTGKMFFLIRRELANVALGYSTSADYCKVKWIDDALPVRLSSPNFLFYKGKIIITGRDQDDLKFKLYSYNLSTHKVEKTFTFPSGYETGYGGMSFNPANNDELWISYYSITSSKSYIYLSKVNLNIFLQ